MKNQRWQTILDLLFLALLFWIARYWYSIHFGFYEDDLTYIPHVLQMLPAQLVEYIKFLILNLYDHARPLHPASIGIFAFWGWNINKLWGIYWFAYVLTIINIGLFYLLIKRTTNRSFAFLCTLAYLLYAADTTQTFISLSFGFQPFITLVLIAFHLYISDRRILSYILAFIILFGYETPFVLFAIAPLFKQEWNKKRFRELIFHNLILITMLVVVFLIRTQTGDDRVANLGLKQLITTPFLHMIQGPIVSLGSFVLRPVQVLSSLNVEIIFVILGSFGILVFLFSRLEVESTLDWRGLWQVIADRQVRRALPAPFKMLGHMLVIGSALLILAYPLTFTVRAYAISGRDTRVHAAGVMGAAILIACFAYFVLLLVQKHWRWVVNLTLAGFFALMVGYGFVVQNDYVRAWQLQKDFWRELLPLIDDAGDGTVILVDPSALTDTRQIGANYWNLPRVLDQIYTFPAEIKDIPRVHRLEAGWQKTLVTPDGRFQVNATSVYGVPDYFGEFDPGNVILIQQENGRLVRRQVIRLNGHDYWLKQYNLWTAPLSLWPGFLYNLLIATPDN
jgi:hypothetical protein